MSHLIPHHGDGRKRQLSASTECSSKIAGRGSVSSEVIPWHISLQMDSLVTLIGLAVVVFALTNIDDVFVLVGFFADKNFRAHDG